MRYKTFQNPTHYRDWRESEEFLPKVYLIGTYGETITKEHLSRQPRFVSSGSVAPGSMVSVANYQESAIEDNGREESPEEGLLRNRTIAKAFQILMNARPAQQT